MDSIFFRKEISGETNHASKRGGCIVIMLIVICPFVSHTDRTTADCHSHCFITPHLCLHLILLLLLRASRLSQTLEGVMQLQTADNVTILSATYKAGTIGAGFKHVYFIKNALFLLEFKNLFQL